MSPVTFSVVWSEVGKGVTCYGFWGLEGGGKGVRCYGFWRFGGAREMVSHVTVALLCIDLHCFALYCLVKQRHVGFATLHLGQFLRFRERREKVSHVTVSGVWMEEGKGVTCYRCIALH